MKNRLSLGARTGPAQVRDCGCNVLPWEVCRHSPGIDREPVQATLLSAAPDSPALAVAKAFHEAYERLAPLNGYETRKETRRFDPGTANGKTMLAVCTELLSEGIIDVGAAL